MPETWAVSWDDLRREFDDSKATIKGFRVETEEEGKERAKRLARKRPKRSESHPAVRPPRQASEGGEGNQ